MKKRNTGFLPNCVVCLFTVLLSFNSSAQNNMDSISVNTKTTLIVTSRANANDLAALQTYVKEVMPMLLALDGKVIKRSKISDEYYGESPGEFLLIMDFPIKQKLIALFKSDEYQSLVPYRNNGFSEMNIMFADDL